MRKYEMQSSRNIAEEEILWFVFSLVFQTLDLSESLLIRTQPFNSRTIFISRLPIMDLNLFLFASMSLLWLSMTIVLILWEIYRFFLTRLDRALSSRKEAEESQSPCLMLWLVCLEWGCFESTHLRITTYSDSRFLLKNDSSYKSVLVEI